MIIKSDFFIKCISWFMKPSAIALYPFIIISPKRIKENHLGVLLNHERIHLEQQKELFLIGFYILYIYFFIRRKSYKSNPFEKEAYFYQNYPLYIEIRKKYAWRDFI